MVFCYSNPNWLIKNLDGLIFPIKRQRLAEWTKTMIQLYAVYKRVMLDPKTQIDWKLKDGNWHSMQMVAKKRAGVAILMSDKADYESKKAYKR